MKILFIGTSKFGAIILEKLAQSEYKPALVITLPDKPVGRRQILTPPPVKIIAQKYNISTLQPEKILNSKSEILNLAPDLIIVVAYGQLIPRAILNIPQKGTLNVHPSLLPKYRGPSPIQETILQGDSTTGVTIMLMDEKIDHGPILLQETFKESIEKYAFSELHDKLAYFGGNLLLTAIPQWASDTLVSKPQDDTAATFCQLITKEQGHIDWNKSARIIEREIRALNPWPGTFTSFKEKTLKILKADILENNTHAIGELFLTLDKKLAIQCGTDALRIEELQLEGKKKMMAQEFINGHKNSNGIILK